MSSEPPPSFFQRFIRRQPLPARDDPADMGTAYGLEASLGANSRGTSNTASGVDTSNDDDPPMGWLSRLTHRRR